MTFLRAFAHMIMSVVLAIVIYRAFPSFEDLKGVGVAALGWLGDPNAQVPFKPFDPAAGVGQIWFLLAFALGFVPDAALYYVLVKCGLTFKARSSELEKHTKVIPLTLLDGIDPLTAFRLEEANIFDMQNLATYNPIMLHIESPYGIYNIIDWVAQAQLCLVAGPERFLALKTLNIRTIFDLEKAVFSGNTVLLDGIGDLLLQDDGRDMNLRNEIGLKKLPALQLPADANGAISSQDRRGAITALTQVMLDDLHVKRLRQLWDRIQKRFDEQPSPPS